MSPKKIKQLNILRKKLDKLDNELLSSIKLRTNLVKKVLELKTLKKHIVDKNRINIILKNVEKKSKKMGIDTKIKKRIWKNMIWAYIDFERRRFKKK